MKSQIYQVYQTFILRHRSYNSTVNYYSTSQSFIFMNFNFLKGNYIAGFITATLHRRQVADPDPGFFYRISRMSDPKSVLTSR